MKNRVYFIIVFIFFSCVSYSANVEWMKGYVVTNESDTIYGELGYRDGTGDWKECFYRQQGEVEYKVYSPEQITAYGYESGLLCSVASFWYNRSLLFGCKKMYGFSQGLCCIYCKRGFRNNDGVV